jgi:CRP/FNR family transcriptional regulator, cyclic AMP receptor protein
MRSDRVVYMNNSSDGNHLGTSALQSPPELISIVDADPDLADLLDPQERERARRQALTRVKRLEPGEWNPSDAMVPDVHHRGFLVIDGLISRQVEVLGRSCVELLGPGDVLRPWSWDPDGSHVHAEVGWMVLEPTQMAVLDHGLVTRMNEWPQLGLELFARGTRRAHSLAVALAIAHHQRVADRLLLTLWHLAERWGRVRREGIAVPLPLPHQRLADLIGAHRPSVTTASGDLVKDGTLSRDKDGVWVLHGTPPPALQHVRIQAPSR